MGTRQERCVVGAMTGTSIDGIDVAAIRVDGCGLGIEIELLSHAGMSLGTLATDLRRAANGEALNAEQFAKLAFNLGELHVEAIEQLDLRGQTIDLIAVHGQTIIHQPPISWQLIDPMPIARQFNAPVINDMRQADLAAGGQGAPITPLADWIMYRDPNKHRAIVNLGGFCNITILPATEIENPLSQIEGFDVCACNHVLDEIARKALNQPFDEGGKAALSGQADTALSEELKNKLLLQSNANRSLGSGDEFTEWVNAFCDKIKPTDLAATAVSAIVRCISEKLNNSSIDEVILAGGGVLNAAMVNTFSKCCNASVIASDQLGIDPQAREAMAIAILGTLCADGIPITLPQVTGCTPPAPIAGRWTLPQVPSIQTEQVCEQNR